MFKEADSVIIKVKRYTYILCIGFSKSTDDAFFEYFQIAQSSMDQ